MKKMESKKVQRPRWLDSLFGPKNSNSQWLQENLEEMNRNFRRMLTIIEDSNAVSFAKKFEMYDQSRQELINLVDKCYRIHCLLAERYNHELLNNIPNSGLIPSQGTYNVSSGKISLPLLSKLRSSKQSNAPVCSVGSRQLKRGVSSIGNNNHIRGQISKNPAIRRNSPLTMALAVRHKPERDSSSCNYFSNYYSDTQSVGDDDEEELEAELRDMIVKLYIQLEGDRVDKALLEEKLDLNVLGLQSQQPVISDVGSDKPSNIPFQRRKTPIIKRLDSDKPSNIPFQRRKTPIIKRLDSDKQINYHNKGKIRYTHALQPESDDSFSRDTQSVDNDDEQELQHEGSDELEAELRDMKKLHILMERDRVVSKFRILRYEDSVSDYYREYGEVKESVKLELNVHSKGGLQNLQSQQRVKISTRPAPMPAAKKIIRFSLPEDSFSSSDDSYTQSDDDDGEELQHEGTDELEAELRDMIEKLYIEMEGDRVVSMLQGGISRYEDNVHDDDEEFRQVSESISSNVDKALLEENLELRAEICRLLKDISSLEEYNEESNERCQSLDKALSQAIEERIEAETLFASEVEQLKASIVKKNNDVEELNKILEAVAAERDQLKARVAMLDADPYKS